MGFGLKRIHLSKYCSWLRMTHLSMKFSRGLRWAGTQNVRTQCQCDQEQSQGEEQADCLSAQKQTLTRLGNTIPQCKWRAQGAHSISMLDTHTVARHMQTNIHSHTHVHADTCTHMSNERSVQDVCLGGTWTCLCPRATAKQVLVLTHTHTITFRK